ncbi:hypothetical protein IMAU30023_01572 [Lactobacillus helveticus]|nr:hypothetical protein [Lactobacillus helveticus]
MDFIKGVILWINSLWGIPMTIKDDEHYEQEDLDLWGVDYQTNKNLPEKVESKLMVESNLLMRFRSQLNKVVRKAGTDGCKYQ